MPRLKPLSACLALSLLARPIPAISSDPDPGQTIRNLAWRLQSTQGLADFATRFHARASGEAVAPSKAPETQNVSNCNDSGSGSLRAAVAAAGNGDTVNMSSLSCSLITLTSGAIAIHVDTLTINGRGQQSLTIDGARQFGIFQHYGSGTLSINDVTLAHGSYGTGGCVASLGNVSLTSATVTSCASTGYGGFSYGGGIIAVGNLTLNSSTLSNNNAYDASFSGDVIAGGGAVAGGNATVTGSTISHNTATSSGADAGGGGLFVAGTLTMTNSTVSGNTAIEVLGVYAAGGGIFAAGNATITASTIDGNNASVGGGLGGGTSTSTWNVVNSTITDNTSYLGGGIVAQVPLHLENSTVALNYSGGNSGGAGVIITVNSVMQSSIIANNNARGASSSADLASAGNTVSVTGANNLIRTSDPLVTLPAGTLHVDPLLASFIENNGGPTQTLALFPNSPAVDAGNNTAGLQFDQRGAGYARVVGARADIGAYEVQNTGDEIFRNGFDPG